MSESTKPAKGLMPTGSMILFWIVVLLVGYIVGLWGGCS